MTLESDLSLLVTRTSTVIDKQEDWIDAEIKIATGSATDPDSFNSTGGKTGDLGYYPIKNANGVTVYMPCLERIKLSLDASRSLLIANGYSAASLKTALAANADLTFIRGAIVTATSTSQRPIQMANGRLDLNGGKIVLDYTDTSASVNVEAKTIKNGTIELAATRTMRRVMRFLDASGRMENITVRQPTYTENAAITGSDYLVGITNDDFIAENVTLENFYLGFNVTGKNAKFSNVTCKGMIKGISGGGGSAIIRGFTWLGTDATATTDPGQGAIGGNWSRLDVEGFYIGPSDDTTTRPAGTGEHAIYIAGLGKALESDIRIVNGRIRRAGQCGLKFKDLAKVHASKVDTSWTSYGNAAGDNEEGYRFQRIGLVTGGELNVTKEMVDGALTGGYAGYTHMFFTGCDNVVLLEESYAEGSQVGGVKFGIDDSSAVLPHGNHMLRVRHKNLGGPSVIIADNAYVNGKIIVFASVEGSPGSPVSIGTGVTWGPNGKLIVIGDYRDCGAAPPASSANVDLSGFVPATSAYLSNIAAIGNLTSAANKAPYWTGAGAAATYDLTTLGRALGGAANEAAARTTLQLGTAATYNIGTSGSTIALLSASNTFSGTQVFSAVKVGSATTNAFGSISNAIFALAGSNGSGSSLVASRWSADSGGPSMALGKSRGAAVGTYAAIQSGDTLGSYQFYGDDGAALNLGASILVQASELWSGTARGTTLSLATVAPGTTSNVIRINIDSASMRPASDNASSIGTGSFRFSVVYAATGTINTSDERAKRDIEAIDEALLDAWASVEWRAYRFKDAFEEKGDGARWHFGLIAQRVRDAIDAAMGDGSALRLGLVCYDAWDAVEERREPVMGERPVEVPVDTGEIDDDGEPILATEMQTEEYDTGEERIVQQARDAGDRWGLRYDECFALESVWQRREISRQAARLSALEARG